MIEPLKPPNDPFEPPVTSSEPPTTPLQPASAEPVQPQADAPQEPITQPQPPYAGAPAYPAQPAQPQQPPYAGQPTYQPYQSGQASVQPGQPVSGPPTTAFPAQPGYPQTAPQGYPQTAPQAYQQPGQPGYPQTAPQGYQQPGQPGYPQTAPQGYPAYGQPGFPGQPIAPKKKSKVPMIIGVVLGVLLLLCGGGGVGAFLIFKNNVDPLGTGYDSPKSAANAFLTAFYVDKDVTKAEGAVCKQARVRKDIETQIERIEGYSTTYNSPKFSWEVTVTGEAAETATAAVKLTMATVDEKVSTQDLTLTVTKLDGWRVCEVQG